MTRPIFGCVALFLHGWCMGIYMVGAWVKMVFNNVVIIDSLNHCSLASYACGTPSALPSEVEVPSVAKRALGTPHGRRFVKFESLNRSLQTIYIPRYIWWLHLLLAHLSLTYHTTSDDQSRLREPSRTA